jgi:hypothetical protein
MGLIYPVKLEKKFSLNNVKDRTEIREHPREIVTDSKAS